MKTALTLIFVFTITCIAYSQNLDLIVTTKGDSIFCKIDSVTESIIYYRTDFGNEKLQLGLLLNEIKSYSYDFVSEIQYELKDANKNVDKENDGTYKYLKQKYARIPYKHYKSDKYSPEAAGFMALIPSVGHFYTGEPLRGLAFVGGMVGSFGTMALGFNAAWDGNEIIGVPLFFVGAAGIIVFYIWNIFDAVKVAKVKNLAIRNNDISLKVLPNIEFSSLSQQPVNNFGVRLVLSF